MCRSVSSASNYFTPQFGDSDLNDFCVRQPEFGGQVGLKSLGELVGDLLELLVLHLCSVKGVQSIYVVHDAAIRSVTATGRALSRCVLEDSILQFSP